MLDSIDLLKPWPILRGLYAVDEQRLNALSDESFLHLRQAGVLPLLYAHLLSVGHQSRLTPQPDAPTIPKADVGLVFDTMDSDLSFDFGDTPKH